MRDNTFMKTNFTPTVKPIVKPERPKIINKPKPNISADAVNTTPHKAIKPEHNCDHVHEAQNLGAQNGFQSIQAGAINPLASQDQFNLSLGQIEARGRQGIYTAHGSNNLESVQSGSGVLLRGHKGESVRETQALLNKFGAGLKTDGLLGPRSEAAIRNFQEAAGLPATGKVDAATLEKLRNGNPADIKPVVPNTTNVQKHSEIDGTATFESVSKAGQRNQMMSGSITVNGNTYQFNSGGHGRGNLPPGDYEIKRHLDSRGDRSMSRDGVGYSFAMSDKYDPRVGDARSLLRIHPDGGSAGTMGCIGIVGDGNVQAQFRADMLAELERNGGTYNLRVG